MEAYKSSTYHKKNLSPTKLRALCLSSLFRPIYGNVSCCWHWKRLHIVSYLFTRLYKAGEKMGHTFTGLMFAQDPALCPCSQVAQAIANLVYHDNSTSWIPMSWNTCHRSWWDKGAENTQRPVQIHHPCHLAIQCHALHRRVNGSGLTCEGWPICHLAELSPALEHHGWISSS